MHLVFAHFELTPLWHARYFFLWANYLAFGLPLSRDIVFMVYEQANTDLAVLVGLAAHHRFISFCLYALGMPVLALLGWFRV